MKRIADFIVSKRYWILGVMVCVTIVCMVLSRQVTVNSDMTKYLPDDSSMKIGMGIMEDEFPELETANTVRVMARGLDEEKREELLAKLEALDYVDSVAHKDAADYNKDEYSLFVISTSYDYGSAEEQAIEQALESDFSEYDIVYRNDDDAYEGISPTLLLTAVVILLVILFIMSESWMEPVLFLLTIGFAVMINSGTNIFLGEISNITSSITAILQLVLSMDYSIILINRYRQEKQSGVSNQEAMTAAVAHAFGSIASSALTTVAGLLALVFMDFKIGVDLGVVLAKGVFISMVCVMLVLPCLILMCDKFITKTVKKAPHIPMGGAAKFCYRFRYVMLTLFVIAFFGFNYLQGNTQIAYTLEGDDPIAEVFPNENMLVMIYDNADEKEAALAAEAAESYDGVKQVLSYPGLLGKPYTSQELGNAIDDLGSSLGADMGDLGEIDPSLLELIYYHYYDGTTEPLAMSDFLRFLSEDVLNNDSFKDVIDDDMRRQADMLAQFADPKELTAPKSAQELADFFDMDAETIEKLLLYYYTQNGNVDAGTMTLPTFVAFILDDVANNPDYSSLFDKATLAQVEKLKTFTDVAAVTTPVSYEKIADMLGMDADTVKLLFVYYQAAEGGYEPGAMTLPVFVNFLQTDVMNQPMFSSYFDEETKAQIGALTSYTDKGALQARHTSGEISSMLGMDLSVTETIFSLYYAQDVSDKTMTLSQFSEFLTGTILANPLFADSFDGEAKVQLRQMNSVVTLAVSGQAFTPEQMAGVLGIEESLIAQLYYLYLSETDAAFAEEAVSMTMPLPDFLEMVKSQASGEQSGQLAQMEQLIATASSGVKLSAAELAGITGMEESAIQMIFTAVSQTAGEEITEMSLTDFLGTALQAAPDNQQLQQVSQMVTLAMSGQALNAETLAAIFGMETVQVQQMFGLALAAERSVLLPAFTEFLVNSVLTNESYSANLDETAKAQITTLNQIVQLAASGAGLDRKTLAGTFGVGEDMVTMVFRLYYGGNTENKTMSMEQTVDFILGDPIMGGYLDSKTLSQLQTAQTLIKATVNGTAFRYNQLADFLGMDSGTVKLLYTYYDGENGAAGGWKLSLQTVVNYLSAGGDTFSNMMSDGERSQLSMAKQLINGSVRGTSYSPEAMARLIGMDASSLRSLYLLYYSEHGDTSGWKLPVQTLVGFLNRDVLTNPDYADMLDEETARLLGGAETMIDAVVSGKEYTPEDAFLVLEALTDELDENTIELLYFYRASQINSDREWMLTIDQLIHYLKDTFLKDSRFAGFVDDEMRGQIDDAAKTLEEGVDMLKSGRYSRMIFYTELPVESAETTEFIENLNKLCAGFGDGYHLIGNSAMSYEMQQTFNRELQIITLLTSIAIFLIVMLSFRSLIIPLLLVLLVQCSVYITVTVVGLQGYSIYFLALLIVECILMGATIDYGILFTNYYRENRGRMEKKEALGAAYQGSIHTIMTSGLIIVLVTGIIGYTTADPTIGQIVRTISTGALCAILMILFVLPSLLAIFDRFIVRKSRGNKSLLEDI